MSGFTARQTPVRVLAVVVYVRARVVTLLEVIRCRRGLPTRTSLREDRVGVGDASILDAREAYLGAGIRPLVPRPSAASAITSDKISA